MATNTAGTAAHLDYTQQVNYLRHRITYLNLTGNVGVLPAGAIVLGGGVHIITAFNDSGTDTLDVGFIGGTTDDNAYATLLDLSAVGFIVLDELAATTNIQQTVDTTVTFIYHPQNSNPTAGVADIVIMYVNRNAPQ